MTPTEYTALVAKLKAERLAKLAAIQAASQPSQISLAQVSKLFTLNAKQLEFAELLCAKHRPNIVLTGPAGTGKTTATHNALFTLAKSGSLLPLSEGTKNLSIGSPSVIGLCYTNRGMKNLRKNMPLEFQPNCLTLHKLLEYAPTYIDTVDANGNDKKSMVFEPTYHALNKLPASIRTIIIDEVSMLSIELYNELIRALPNPSAVQFVFLGDIQQLAPVFGDAVFGYKLFNWHTIELTEVYRNQGPILDFAHRILSGIPIKPEELTEKWQHPGKLTIARWKVSTPYQTALNTAVDFLIKRYKANTYSPTNDMVILPYKKEGNFSTREFNKLLVSELDKLAPTKPVVKEIIAGYFKVYFAVTDYVLHKKEEYIIIDIKPNPSYVGKLTPKHDVEFDRYGNQITASNLSLDDMLALDASAIANAALADEDTVNSASHILTLCPLDMYEAGTNNKDKIGVITIQSRGELSNLEYGYSTTVHSAQGLQAPRVFFLLHANNNTLISRELLYTGATRAQSELVILCDNNTFVNGVIKQQNKGLTLQEKADYFKGKEDKSKLILH